MPELQVIFEDNHLLVVDKPAGIATMGTTADVPSLARQAAAYLKRKYNKPGNVFVGVVSRLDSLVSGVIVLARTSKAASRLSEQIRSQTTRKRYLAFVEGELAGQHAVWHQLCDYVVKNEAAHRMQTVAGPSQHAQEAKLRYRPLATSPTLSLLEVELITGRKHQIRVQLAALGHPILGDVKYESQRRFAPGIALHSFRLSIAHPTQQQAMSFESWPHQWSKVDDKLWRRGVAVLREENGLREENYD